MPPETVPPRETLSKSRLEALSDGIFAFAMTLLVLSLTVPMVSQVEARWCSPDNWRMSCRSLSSS